MCFLEPKYCKAPIAIIVYVSRDLLFTAIDHTRINCWRNERFIAFPAKLHQPNRIAVIYLFSIEFEVQTSTIFQTLILAGSCHIVTYLGKQTTIKNI